MKPLFFLIPFITICLCLSAQSYQSRNIVREFSFKDTNYIYIGIINKFNLEREKLGITRITPNSTGISSKLYDTYFEISPKHQGFFSLTMETPTKKYKVLFVAKRVSLPDL